MFIDRQEAGKKLAIALAEYKRERCLVLALPRGGVPVGFEIAQVFGCPLDTIVARKIGTPENPEFALGALAPGNIVLLDVPREGLEEIIWEEEQEMKRRMEKYKSGSYSEGAKPDVVIIVDDGVATGQTARAGLLSARASYPSAKLIFAAPVGSPDSISELWKYADNVVCLEMPPNFSAVGEWYEHFDQTTDDEVIEYLEKAARF